MDERRGGDRSTSRALRGRTGRSAAGMGRWAVRMGGWAVLATVAVGAPGTARGETATLQVANQLEAYYDTNLEETVLDDRLDALLGYGPFTLGATFLSHSPSDPILLDPNDYGVEQQGIRKRWIQAQAEHFGVRLGDVYGTFGRGLALRIFEDQTVDFDNALDGVHGLAELGPYEIEVIGGTNSYDAPFQVIKGARGSWAPRLGWKLGLQGVWSDSTATGLAGRPGGDRLYGGLFEGDLGGRIGLYGEYVLREHRNFRQSGIAPADGHAGYANANLYLGRLQVLTEYKDLLRYDLPYVNPPTAVRQHTTTLLNRATHVQNIRLEDERGGLVEAWLSATDKAALAASFSRSEARHSYQPAWELFGELEYWFTPHTELVLRAAESEETVLEGGESIFFEKITYAATVLFPLSELWSVDATVETQEGQESNRETASFAFPLEYRNNLISVTLNRAPSMSWAITTEWTDDDRETKDAWLWAEWNIRLGDRHQLLLGGGSLRGGQVCSGGVCKLVDPFEGGRLELLTTF